MANIEQQFQVLSAEELMNVEGGGVISEIGDFVGKTWNTLYQSGRDFGRSIMNALIK